MTSDIKIVPVLSFCLIVFAVLQCTLLTGKDLLYRADSIVIPLNFVLYLILTHMALSLTNPWCPSGVHCDAAAAADSTADSGVGSDKGAGTIPSYGDFSESDRKILEETGTKQEFQAEV